MHIFLILFNRCTRLSIVLRLPIVVLALIGGDVAVAAILG